MSEAPWTLNPTDYRPPTLEGLAPQVIAAKRPMGSSQTVGYRIQGASDAQLSQKIGLLRDKIIGPALGTGPRGLAFTRGLLAEALGKAAPGVNGHNKSAEAVRIFEWVRGRVRYVNDPGPGELFQQIPDLWAAKIGDCEDFTALLAALFIAAGIKVKARVIQIRGKRGWAHIYPVALLGGKWRAFDATEPQRAGWEFPAAIRRADFEVS